MIAALPTCPGLLAQAKAKEARSFSARSLDSFVHLLALCSLASLTNAPHAPQLFGLWNYRSLARFHRGALEITQRVFGERHASLALANLALARCLRAEGGWVVLWGGGGRAGLVSASACADIVIVKLSCIVLTRAQEVRS